MVVGRRGDLQTNFDFFLKGLFIIVVWRKQLEPFYMYYRIEHMSKTYDVVGSQCSHCERKGHQTMECGEGNRYLCRNPLELEVSLRIHDF